MRRGTLPKLRFTVAERELSLPHSARLVGARCAFARGDAALPVCALCVLSGREPWQAAGPEREQACLHALSGARGQAVVSPP